MLKHEILRQYVVPFVSKVGRNATGSRVVYLDGYAGPGSYADGTPGSPALVLQSAAQVAEFRSLDCYFIERKREDFKRLKILVEEARAKGINAEALHGRVEKHLDHVLERAEGAPLLAFLDPFGLGLSFDDLTGKIFGPRRPRGAGWNATEALLNFSANAVRRIGGHLTAATEYRNTPATLAAMDAACGGSWWRDEFCDSKDNSEAVERIANGYAKRVCKTIGSGAWIVAVRNGNTTSRSTTWCSSAEASTAYGCSARPTRTPRKRGAGSAQRPLSQTHCSRAWTRKYSISKRRIAANSGSRNQVQP